VQVRLGRADFLGTAQSQTASPALPARLNPAAQAVTSTIAFASTSLRPSQAPRRRALRRGTPTAAGIGAWPATPWGSSSPSPGRPRCRSDR